ncbi:hypothetical protein HF086_013294 [Spodoptera exigua]|uniref:Uncharacterized protein n=1 Tax=Spodoptera exigua TaxID=7107 RepID=A0A922SK69_SPOEX|nr:hypothetical protein HF086_013294 [Spodoptera exigua]
MAIPLLLLLFLTIFKVETFPTKIIQINQQQTKNYEVFKDILIQNLIVTTDNLKMILNLEREDTYYKVHDELINYNNNIIPKQNDLWKNFKGDNEAFKVTTDYKDFKQRSIDLPGGHETQGHVEAQDDNVKEDKLNRKISEELSLMKSQENLSNYDNSDSLQFDTTSDEKTKRQAGDDSGLPIRGDGDTQMFMGTFQAVMRPMKLPSLS